MSILLFALGKIHFIYIFSLKCLVISKKKLYLCIVIQKE